MKYYSIKIKIIEIITFLIIKLYFHFVFYTDYLLLFNQYFELKFYSLVNKGNEIKNYIITMTHGLSSMYFYCQLDIDAETIGCPSEFPDINYDL